MTDLRVVKRLVELFGLVCFVALHHHRAQQGSETRRNGLALQNPVAEPVSLPVARDREVCQFDRVCRDSPAKTRPAQGPSQTDCASRNARSTLSPKWCAPMICVPGPDTNQFPCCVASLTLTVGNLTSASLCRMDTLRPSRNENIG